MGVAIEDMTGAHLDAVLAIDLASFPSHETAAADVRREQLRAELARPFARVRVATDAGVVVGYVLTWHVADEVHLLNVAVAPEDRRKGIGRALVAAVVDAARASSAAKILLEVRASNAAAIALYDAFGFARVNVRRGYYADGEDAVELALDVTRT